MKPSKFPAGWNEKRVQNLIHHYEAQTEDEAVAEDESAFENRDQTTIQIPRALLPIVRELVSKHSKSQTQI